MPGGGTRHTGHQSDDQMKRTPCCGGGRVGKSTSGRSIGARAAISSGAAARIGVGARAGDAPAVRPADVVGVVAIRLWASSPTHDEEEPAYGWSSLACPWRRCAGRGDRWTCSIAELQRRSTGPPGAAAVGGDRVRADNAPAICSCSMSRRPRRPTGRGGARDDHALVHDLGVIRGDVEHRLEVGGGMPTASFTLTAPGRSRAGRTGWTYAAVASVVEPRPAGGVIRRLTRMPAGRRRGGRGGGGGLEGGARDDGGGIRTKRDAGSLRSRPPRSPTCGP